MGDIDILETLEFTVQGIPVPQGSKSLFRGRMVDANKNLKPWRATVTRAAREAIADRPGFDDAVYVLLDFHMPRGKTVRRARPSVKPDIDKLTRSIFDALTDANAWTDDGLVVSVHAQQWYADDEPYVRIKIGRLA